VYNRKGLQFLPFPGNQLLLSSFYVSLLASGVISSADPTKVTRFRVAEGGCRKPEGRGFGVKMLLGVGSGAFGGC
jgi:hypothetical protein